MNSKSSLKDVFKSDSSYRYPKDIPANTSVPAWAYGDVVSHNTFNVTSAEMLANQNPPDSSAPPSPTSTGAGGESSSSGGASNVGPIVGGVVGGVVFLAAILAGLFFYYRRRRTDRPSPMDPRDIDLQRGPWSPGAREKLLGPNVLVPSDIPAGAKFYVRYSTRRLHV